MSDITDEIVVDKAIEQYGRPRVSLTAHRAAMRRALEVVVPDIERPLRRRLAGVEGDYERTEAELARIGARLTALRNGSERVCGEMLRRVRDAEALLVERDKEIERLRRMAKADTEDMNGFSRLLVGRDKEIGRLQQRVADLHDFEWLSPGQADVIQDLRKELVERDQEIERLQKEIERLREVIRRTR